MNFSCDKCERRYSIADDKVRGKTVKVRCKNCQNVISVQGPPLEMEESTRVVSLADVERIREQERAVAAASAGSAQSAPAGASPWEDEPTRAAPARPASAPWFVMVKSKQEGPLDEAGLQALVESGAVNGRSFFWQQGMADWKRGAELPELAFLFAPPAPAPTPAPPPPAAPVMAPEPATVSVRGPRGTAATAARAQAVPEEHGWDDVPTTVGQAAVGREPWDLDPPVAEQPRQQRQAQSQRQQQAAWDEPQQEPQAAWDEPQQEPQAETPWNESEPQQAQPAWDEPAQPEQAWGEPQQQPAARTSGNVSVGDDLFSDLDLPDRNEHADLAEPPTAINSDPDPLAAVRGGKNGQEDKRPVEDTRHFMMKSGVTKRNPVWKVALFILAPIFLVVGTLYVLSTLNVVPLNVTTVNAQGQKVEKSVFSGEGVSELRDRLMGRSKPPPAPATQSPAGKKPNGAGQKPGAGTAEEAKPAVPETGKSAEEIKALMADGSKQDVSPTVRKNAEVAAKDAAGKGGPPPEDIKKVVEKSQGAIQGCVETELRKNPSFKGGKVLLVATVGTSGTVKSAKLDRKELDASPVGDCIKKSARRMVFPRFKAEDGAEEVDLEIPLVLSSGAM